MIFLHPLTMTQRWPLARPLEQCVQIFFVKMREVLLKMREKIRQPKMATFLLHFCTFQGWFGFKFFKKNYFEFYFIFLQKFEKVKMRPLLGFSRIARNSKINAREGVNMRHFRTKSHLDTLLSVLWTDVRSLKIYCFFGKCLSSGRLPSCFEETWT